MPAAGGGRHHHRMAEHQWSSAEHQDGALHQPVGLNPELAGVLVPELAGVLVTLDPPKPVWADIAFESIPDVLHRKCFNGRVVRGGGAPSAIVADSAAGTTGRSRLCLPPAA